jgi:hypothetical protein
MMRRIMRHGLSEIAAATDPIGRVRALLTSGALDFACLGPSFLDAVRHHPPSRLLFDRRVSEGRDALVKLIEAAIAAGDFRPVNVPVVAEAFLAVVINFMDPEFHVRAGVSSGEGLAQMADVMLDGLRPR